MVGQYSTGVDIKLLSACSCSGFSRKGRFAYAPLNQLFAVAERIVQFHIAVALQIDGARYLLARISMDEQPRLSAGATLETSNAIGVEFRACDLVANREVIAVTSTHAECAVGAAADTRLVLPLLVRLRWHGLR